MVSVRLTRSAEKAPLGSVVVVASPSLTFAPPIGSFEAASRTVPLTGTLGSNRSSGARLTARIASTSRPSRSDERLGRRGPDWPRPLPTGRRYGAGWPAGRYALWLLGSGLEAATTGYTPLSRERPGSTTPNLLQSAIVND